jgi:hypothetical protein
VTRFIRERQHARRARKGADVAYLIYVVVLVLGAYVAPFGVALGHLSTPNRGSDVAAAVTAGLPTAMPTLFLGAYLLAGRDALWRGPVTPAAALTEWLLPTPLSRRRLLVGRYLSSLLLNVLAAAALGLVLGFGVYTCGLGSLPALLVSGAIAGALTGATSTGLALGVQRGIRPGRLSTAVTVVVCALMATGSVLTAIAVVHRRPLTGTSTLDWIGPWGWAAQIILRAADVRSSGWPVAAALAAVCALAAGWAVRSVPGLDANDLRRRSRTFADVAGSVQVLDFRQARLSSQVSRRPARGRRFRLPVPRSPRLVTAWRDGMFALRFGWKVVNAGLGVAIATAAFWWAGEASHSAQPALVLAGSIAYYLAAAQLVETARLEADDPGRSDPLRPGFGALALQHAVVPTAVLLTTTLVAAVAVDLSTPAGPAILLLPAAALVAIAAALVGAYRGPLPAGLLGGALTPMGDFGPVLIGIWYLRGALAMLVVLVPAMVVTIRGQASASDLLTGYLVLLVAGQLILVWVRHTAGKLRGQR